ncbi:hypothetical protein PVAP13_4NG339275 [Panicum virgatum]|uniref:Secreted protein n=1 Tax=Panicum virgatum TaxID=38727 RepID=A0A8T0TIX5_PANVG|nr:hypothetical protein PVAP13_4NG339275 [Panicum virgatum]
MVKRLFLLFIMFPSEGSISPSQSRDGIAPAFFLGGGGGGVRSGSETRPAFLLPLRNHQVLNYLEASKQSLSPRLLAASVPGTLRPALFFLWRGVALLREPLVAMNATDHNLTTIGCDLSALVVGR